MSSQLMLGEECRRKIEATVAAEGSWPKAAKRLNMSKWTLYRLARGERGVGFATAAKLKAGLHLRTTDEVFE